MFGGPVRPASHPLGQADFADPGGDAAGSRLRETRQN